MDKWLKRQGMSVGAKDLAEAGSSKNPEMGPASVARKKKRMYDESYVQYGFTYSIGNHDEQLPLCLLCNETLAAESMKPTKLEKYLLASYQIAKPKNHIQLVKNLFYPLQYKLQKPFTEKSMQMSYEKFLSPMIQ
ncbi:hypothetical protein CBL_20149 [Carabus blaptoides fortunei]